MVGSSLEIFVRSVMARGVIAAADIRALRRDVLPHGPCCRDEADVLLALDRAIAVKDAGWAAFLVDSIAAFVVWTSRPTGYVDHETAVWLTASLSAGTGPTEAAKLVAFEVVREAERSDATLLTFVMRSAAARPEAEDEAVPFDRAA